MSTGVDQFLAELCSGEDARAERAAAQSSGLPAHQLQLALEALRQLLASPDADRRWWVARALAEIADPRVPGWLMELLADREASVRQCAALGLRLHPDAQALPALVQALGDDDCLVARLAADALAAVGQAAVTALLEVVQKNGSSLSQPGPNARRESVRAMAAIGDPRLTPALFEALEDDSPLVVYWAEQGLERMGVGMVFF